MSAHHIDVRKVYLNILGAKYLSIVSCTILVYDILNTLPTEIRFVWKSRWSFGRVAFHLNRLWAPIVLAVYVPTLFMYRLSNTTCLAVSLFYIYGSVVAMLIVTSVLVVRIWVIYDRKKWVLASVCFGCFVVSVPSLVFLQSQAQAKNLVTNPAPDYVTGCIFDNSNTLTYIPYIAPFLYETMLFGMTVYKTWKIARTQIMATPILVRLRRDGSTYYFVVIGTIIFVGVGSFVPFLGAAVNGSGIFLAVLSSMCSRLILSTRSFYDEANVTDEFLEMNTLPTTNPSDANANPKLLGATSSSSDRQRQVVVRSGVQDL